MDTIAGENLIGKVYGHLANEHRKRMVKKVKLVGKKKRGKK